jgi:RimJ/RimL family protein N-acetyltransferase
MRQFTESQSANQQLVQFGILVATLGVILGLIGLYPGVTGVEPKSGIGILQIIILLFGMTLVIVGAMIFVKVGFYPTAPSNLAQRIAIRLSFTGLLFSAAVGLSDVLGYGSNPPNGDESFPILGIYQVAGLVIGFVVALFGVVLFLVAGPVYETPSDKRKTIPHIKPVTPLDLYAEVLEITIREAVPDDAEAFLSLQKQLDRETEFMMLEVDERTTTIEETRSRLQEIADKEQQVILVADDGGKLVGYLSVSSGEYRRIRHTAYIVIGILQAYRGQKIGTRLFEKLEKWAKEHKIHRLELTVMAHNEVAIALYQKMGFKVEGTKRDAMKINGRYVDELYMAKLIEG